MSKTANCCSNLFFPCKACQQINPVSTEYRRYSTSSDTVYCSICSPQIYVSQRRRARGDSFIIGFININKYTSAFENVHLRLRKNPLTGSHQCRYLQNTFFILYCQHFIRKKDSRKNANKKHLICGNTLINICFLAIVLFQDYKTGLYR